MNIDPDLKQKADIERQRNKLRQREKLGGLSPRAGGGDKESLLESRSTMQWRKEQDKIDNVLDPSMGRSLE